MFNKMILRSYFYQPCSAKSPFHVFWIFSGPDEAVFIMEQCEQKYGGYLIENVAEIEVTLQNKTTYH